jgi:nucleoside-diphosphate-sugar epimerase
MSNILITGACGQLGTELTSALRGLHGPNHVIASDITRPSSNFPPGPFELLNVMDKSHIHEFVEQYDITQIYHLAAMLSAKAEKHPRRAWNLNVGGLLNILDIAKEQSLGKVYWPSSIAVFGPDAPSEATPQHAPLNPTTVYGIGKIAGEQWCAYYFRHFGVDVRSLRYPGLIGFKSMPGGGTTDYAVDIFHHALAEKKYECFLSPGSKLPMMYMDDAVRATIELMEADQRSIHIRSSYNIAAMSFSPEEISAAIRQYIPDLEISYRPDYRQKISESWPCSLDDSEARRDWNWQARYNLEKMTKDMLNHLKNYKQETYRSR